MASPGYTHSVCAILVLTAICAYAAREYNAAEGQVICYECYNIVKGKLQPHCPKNGTVGKWTWTVNCTGKCYIKTDDQNADLIYRGCTDNHPDLPKPLPEDGCYKFYLEEWCVCGSDGCNGVAMGEVSDTELDAHLPTEPGKSTSAHCVVCTPWKIINIFLTICLINQIFTI